MYLYLYRILDWDWNLVSSLKLKQSIVITIFCVYVCTWKTFFLIMTGTFSVEFFSVFCYLLPLDLLLEDPEHLLIMMSHQPCYCLHDFKISECKTILIFSRVPLWAARVSYPPSRIVGGWARYKNLIFRTKTNCVAILREEWEGSKGCWL